MKKNFRDVLPKTKKKFAMNCTRNEFAGYCLTNDTLGLKRNFLTWLGLAQSISTGKFFIYALFVLEGMTKSAPSLKPYWKRLLMSIRKIQNTPKVE